jgi:hypothetical protein
MLTKVHGNLRTIDKIGQKCKKKEFPTHCKCLVLAVISVNVTRCHCQRGSNSGSGEKRDSKTADSIMADSKMTYTLSFFLISQKLFQQIVENFRRYCSSAISQKGPGGTLMKCACISGWNACIRHNMHIPKGAFYHLFAFCIALELYKSMHA